MDAGSLPAQAQRGGEGERLLTPADSTEPAAALLDELCAEGRIIGWSEGIHNRAEYLGARNAAIRHLVESGSVAAIAAETNVALAQPADAFVRGDGPEEPTAAAVRGVWSWNRDGLLDNLRLLHWLRQHNSRRPDARRVRFYGLDRYGTGYDTGGDHRDIVRRDAAQYAALEAVAARHPSDRILLFEQTGHLDRRIPGSLGDTIARGSLGPYRVVGALWRDGDPTVTYPLGPYAALSRWLAEHPDAQVPVSTGIRLLDLRPFRSGAQDPAAAPVVDAATAFDAMLYAPSLTPASTMDD